LGIEKPDDVTKQEIKNIASDDRLTTLSGEIGDIDTEISDLQQQMQNLKTDIEDEFPTSISKSALNAITYDRQIGLNNQMQSKLAVREAKAADYQRVKQERELELQRKLQQQQQTMDFLSANNGAALYSMSGQELQDLEVAGRIPVGYADMFSNMTESMIGNQLAQL
jgi:predicted RNase H-like nuclease (RuvC/YqgF family)